MTSSPSPAARHTHPARWFTTNNGPSYDVDMARTTLAKAVDDGLAPAGEPPSWGELQWAQLFREPPGPAIRPVSSWRAAVRIVLSDAGPVAATKVLLAHANRHGRRKLSNAQEAPAARDVRQSLAQAPDDLYEQAVAVALEHRVGAAARRLAAYLFPDQPWWEGEAQGDWLDLAPCPREINTLPTSPPKGIGSSYLHTLAQAYGDAAVPRIADWSAHNSSLAQILLAMDTDDSVSAWLGLWHARASNDAGFREGITAAWRSPVRLLRAALQLALLHPSQLHTTRRWIASKPEAAATLAPTLQGEAATLFEQLRPKGVDDRGLPEGWSERVLGSRRFPSPESDASARQTAIYAAPLLLLKEGLRVGPPRTWTRETTRSLVTKSDAFRMDLLHWVVDDAGVAAAVALLLDTAQNILARRSRAAANLVRNHLSRVDERVYSEALAVAVAARGSEPSKEVAQMSAFLFPDQPWWIDVVDSWASESSYARARKIGHFAPLPEDPADLPSSAPIDVGFNALLPSWIAAYSQRIEPHLIRWLSTHDSANGPLTEALLALRSTAGIQAVVQFAYEPTDTYRSVMDAKAHLDTFAMAHPRLAMSALAKADLQHARTALRRLVWRWPDVAATIDDPVLRELLVDVHPSRPPTPVDQLPPCFHPPKPPPDARANVPRPTITDAVRLSDLERAQTSTMRELAAAPSTGLGQWAARILNEGPEVLRPLKKRIAYRTDATAPLLDSLTLFALHVHGTGAADEVRRTHAHYQSPPAALCNERVAKWMIEHFDLALVDTDREGRSEPLSEYRMDDVWRTQTLTREWVRRHPDDAAAMVLWAALSPSTPADTSDNIHFESNDLSALLATLRSLDAEQPPSDSLRLGAQQAIPWMLHHMPGVLERTAADLAVEQSLAPWIEHPGPVTTKPGGDLAWIELWRLPWLELVDGRVLCRQAEHTLIELLAHTDPAEPHGPRDEALELLAPHSKVELSEALRAQWEEDFDAFGSWVVCAPELLSDPQAAAWHRELLTTGAQDSAMNAMYQRGDEAELIAARLSVNAMHGTLEWHTPNDNLPRSVGLQVRIDGLRASRGIGPWTPARTAPPLTPPDEARDDRYSGRRVPIERFEVLAATGWIGGPDRLTLAISTGVDLALELTSGVQGQLTLGRLALRDVFDPSLVLPLSYLSDADWGQAIADLDLLTQHTSAPDRAAAEAELTRAIDKVANSAKWVCVWAARGDAPSFIWQEALDRLDKALRTLRDLAAPFGGFEHVHPHAEGVFELTWRDGERVVVGERPKEPTGVAIAVNRATSALLAE